MSTISSLTVKHKLGEEVDNDDDFTKKTKQDEENVITKECRLPKQKVALLLGYNGAKYQGMQMNEGANTVESTLWKALCSAGAVSEANSTDPHKVSFARAARTDKGVHAAGQVVSLKMMCTESITEKINLLLPKDIKLYRWIKTSQSFNPKLLCDSRAYEYLLPTFALNTNRPFLYKDVNSDEVLLEDSSDLEENIVQPISDEQLMADKLYRITPEQLDFLSQILSKYTGTHSFHNFTIGKAATDPSATRYIISFVASPPFISHDLEWISLKVYGQSFMLHQIRKMVGLAIMIIRNHLPLSVMDVAFAPEAINIPKVPGHCLLLDHPIFNAYSKRFPNNQPLTFGDEKDQFKKEVIYPSIFESEISHHYYSGWLNCIAKHQDKFNYI